MKTPWQNLNTPQTLWASLYLIWALDAMLLIAAITGARVHRAAMQVIGKDSAPSIIHAQHIKAALADMDADAANELLGAPSQASAAVEAYEKRRKEAATALIEAAKNITYPGEQDPIEDLQIGLGTYEAKIQQARDLHEWEDESYVSAYREAARAMDDEVLPRADKLDEVNRTELDKTYAEQSGKSIAGIGFILAVGAALTAALVAIQKFLNRKMRRILNPMLILTTLLVLGFVLYTFNVLGEERHQLKVAREDAFESIHALWRARAVAYSANADESRYLLDVAHAWGYEQKFHQKAAELAGTSFDRMLEEAGQGRKVEGDSYLARELNNITFPGELIAATDALARFRDYMNIDARIRSLQQNGKHAEALALCMGMNEGESNWAFDRFDQAITRTIQINQDEFDRAVDRGFSALSNFEIKATIVAVIIALLAFFGLLKRLQEYR